MTSFLTLINVLPLIPESPFVKPIDWQINEGEIWTLTGTNGCGKSLLAEVICGHFHLIHGHIKYNFFERIKHQNTGEALLYPSQCIKIVSFSSVFSLSDFRDMYYQKRFNSTETENNPLVSELLYTEEKKTETVKKVIELFNIQKLMDHRLIQLSSGELRKLLIAKILLEKPRLLILDNPFIGLDAKARSHLSEIFPLLSKSNIQLLFLAPSSDDIPECTTHIIEMNNGKIISKSESRHFNKKNTYNELQDFFIDWQRIPPMTNGSNSDEVVRLDNIEISYGERVINKEINWRIKKGEYWALLGPNGSGKSTLLSYIFADNPQGYAKELRLFGSKRGTGESIWDIKKRIGFTSSEMHLYYRYDATCLKIVESGFFDSIGLYHKCSDEQTRIATYLLKVLSIDKLKERSFLQVSSGEQRLILLARSLVKNPELLILDEPFQGMDNISKQKCKQLVESYCKQQGKSLIFVTHFRDEIPSCIDHFLELK